MTEKNGRGKGTTFAVSDAKLCPLLKKKSVTEFVNFVCLDETVTENTFIEPPIEMSEVRGEPFSLPSAFRWCDVDVHDNKELTELYTLLSENYVEDDDNMFRFDYSSQFLLWYVFSAHFNAASD